MHILDLYIYI